jgi:hypothetical protein
MAVSDQAAASSQWLVRRIANSRRSGWKAVRARAAHCGHVLEVPPCVRGEIGTSEVLRYRETELAVPAVS